MDITENIANHREIDQLKELLQDKDKHIQDLTDTLRHFHVIIQYCCNTIRFC